MVPMGRWKPDARSRLERAALELYGERGFAETTVAEIAQRAGLTERTFFRYFADKREVLFSGASALEDAMLSALSAAPAELPAIDAAGVAIAAIAPLFRDRHRHARTRSLVIAANPELEERERIKLGLLASVLAEGLRRRGVADSAAVLAAEVGIAVFRIAFARWIADDEPDFAESIAASLRELKAVTAGDVRL
jgi:AcrR family transcriptional regulator